MNTPSMIVSPSIILLQPHVGGFHASDQEKITISGNVWPSSGGIAACRLLNSGCLAMYRCITSWWTLPAWLKVHPSYFYSHMLAGFMPQITISCRSSGNVWPSSGGIAACRLLNSGCLAMYRCITLPNNHYSTTYMLLYTPTWWPNIAWTSAGHLDFFLIWGMKPANMWL